MAARTNRSRSAIQNRKYCGGDDRHDSVYSIEFDTDSEQMGESFKDSFLSSPSIRSLTNEQASVITAAPCGNHAEDFNKLAGSNTGSIPRTSSVKKIAALLARSVTRKNKSLELVFDDKAILIQRKFREHYYKRRFHRKNLADRLIFESDLMVGSVRLFKQLLVFGLLIASLNVSSNEQAKRGIYTDIDHSFDFDGLRQVNSRDDFISSWVPSIAASSKKYFTRSSAYFDAGGAGTVELHARTEIFSESVLLGGLMLSIHLPSFSTTAWVQLVPEFLEGYIFRKRPQPAGTASKLSCWGEAASDTLIYTDKPLWCKRWQQS
jgi:hypothetical protein